MAQAQEAIAAGARQDVAEDQVYVASQWQLMWWRLRKHRLAMGAGVVLVIMYLIVIGADFLATSDPFLSEARRGEMSPQRVHFFDGWKPDLHVNSVTGARDPKTFKRVYTADPDVKIPIRFFARGFEYKFMGLITTDRHLLGVDAPAKAEEIIFILGTDVQRVVSPHVLDTHLHDDRPGQRGDQPVPGSASGRTVRLLRRVDRHGNPASHRDSTVDTHDTAVDGNRGRCAERLVHNQSVFCDNDNHLADRLDYLGP